MHHKKIQFDRKSDYHLDSGREVGVWSVLSDDVTVGGFVKKKPTKVRPATQNVGGHGRCGVITKVVAPIAVAHVLPPQPQEEQGS